MNELTNSELWGEPKLKVHQHYCIYCGVKYSCNLECEDAEASIKFNEPLPGECGDHILKGCWY